MMIEDFLPQSDLDIYKSLKSKDARRIFIQEAAKKHFALLVYILGYRDLGEFHSEELKRISAVRRMSDFSCRRLWLWARGHFKTSLITEAHSIYLIINNPNIRILLVSNTIGVAEKILKNIKDKFTNNEEFRYFFKEFCPQENKVGKIEFGTTEYFTTPARRRQFKEPTMMVAGIGTNLTGLHFDYQKIDDLVTEQSVTNDTQIQASKDYYSGLRQLFDNASFPKEDVIGTVYHFNDLYNDMKKSGRFEMSFIPVRDTSGKINFKERFSEDTINSLITDPTIGPYTFSTQYMLNPVNPLDAKFKDTWVNYVDEVPTGLAEYIFVDPASTQKKKSDYTVMERWGVDHEGAHYLLEGVRDKLTSFQRVDRLFSMVTNSRNLKFVKYEVLGGRHGDLELIKAEQIKRQVFFMISETKSSTAAKADRIEQRLVAPYHAGVIHWPRKLMYKSLYDGKVHNFIEEFLLELLQFPFSEHDDILDCQSQMFEDPKMIMRGENSVVVEERKTTGMTADEWERMYNNLEKLRTSCTNTAPLKNSNNSLTHNQMRDKWLVRKFKKIVARGG